MPAWSALFNDVQTATGQQGTGHAAERIANKTNKSAAGRAITVALRGRGGQQLRGLLEAFITGTPTVVAEVAKKVVHPDDILTDPGAYGARQGTSAVENITLRAAGAASATVTAQLNTMLDETKDAAVAAVDKSGNGLGGKAGQI